MSTLACHCCGKEFTPRHSRQKTCGSDECKKDWNRTKNSERTRVWLTVPGNREKANRRVRERREADPERYRESVRRSRDKRRKQVYCAVCGQLITKKPARKTCGPECGRQWQMHLNREYAKRRRALNPEKARQESRERNRQIYATNAEYRRKRRHQQIAWREANRELYLAWRREYAKRWRDANHTEYRIYQNTRSRTDRAAKSLGIPPLLFAAMKIMSQLQEPSHDTSQRTA